MRESCKLDPVSTLFWTREIGTWAQDGFLRSTQKQGDLSRKKKIHSVLILTKIKVSSLQKRSKLEFLSSCCDLVILVDFCTYSLLISVLKGLWDASAHVRQLDFSSGEQFFKIGVLVKKSSSIDPETPEKAIISVFKSYLVHLGSFKRYILYFCASIVEKIRSHWG